ncbi:unnamed protein product [Caenorhabditis angaria]|uniref:Nuclear receptor domain-containing protein n=1 Tax=Caenorhabditis angaria TaxID=860376 RepID=A0A9P1ITJ1_9PELO|nr:unnamed protein product [Caenorhabditis angaria]
MDEKSPKNIGTCLVCEKPADSHHYNILCCHGCKSFFRRAILIKKTFPDCFRGSNCYTKSAKILNCRACRYQKCFQVGMVAQFATERKNRSVQAVVVRSENEEMLNIIKNLSILDFELNQIRNSEFHPLFPDSLKTIVNSTSIIGNAQKYQQMTGWPLEIEEFIGKQRFLSKMKFEAELGIVQEQEVRINTKDWLPFDMLLSIEYTKTFQFFGELSTDDRVSLIQNTGLMCLAITSAYSSYQRKKDILQTPDGICLSGPPAMVGKLFDCFVGYCDACEGVRDPPVIEMLKKNIDWRMGVKLIIPLVREQFKYSEYLILKAIIVANPAAGLSNDGQKIVQKERKKLSRALLDLCFSNFGRINGPSRFITLISYINLMESNQKDFRNLISIFKIFKPRQSLRSSLPEQIILADSEVEEGDIASFEASTIMNSAISTTTISTTTAIKSWHCLDDTWTMFDRDTYYWCMKPVYKSITLSEGAALCESLQPAAVLSGFQNANEISVMADEAVAHDSTMDDLAVGAVRSDDCKTQASLNTEACTSLNMFYWTDGYTTGTDGFIWYPTTPNGCFYGGCAEDFYASLYIHHKQLDDLPGTRSIGGAFCGMLAEYY